MKLYFLNVGYGEAVVVQSGGSTLVVDGGSGRDAVYAQPHTIRLAQFLHAIGVSHIELLCITHIHEDHIGGVPAVLEQFSVGEIWCNIFPQGDIGAMLARLGERARSDPSGALFCDALAAYARICAMAAERGIPLRAAAGGTVAACGGLSVTALGMTQAQLLHTQARFEEMIAASEERFLFELFHENDFICNATSLACRVCAGGAAALLTGDKVGGWQALRQQTDLRAQVLKITHHGQKDGMPQDMLEGADPAVLVICADKNRTYHSADPSVLRRAEEYLTQKGRQSRIFITGSLRRDGKAGNVLTVEIDETQNCIKTAVENYE